MANDAGVDSSSLTQTKASDIQDQQVSAIRPKMGRKCYSMVELMDLATKPLSKRCPAPLNYENASNNPWLLKIVPGPHQEVSTGQSSNDRPAGTAEERARVLRSQDSELGMTFKPQRLSFTDGCRTSSISLSPQKNLKAISMLSTNKENRDYETFGERNRDRPQDGYGGGMMRGGSREFVNTRLQSNNNPRYGTYNDERDRYNNNLGRGYNDRAGQGGFQRSFSREPYDDRGYDRGFRNRDQDRGDDQRSSSYHPAGDLEQEEPEWMNDGPTSQTEYIELRGFDDDVPEDEKAKDKDEKPVNGFVVDKISGELRREIIAKDPPKETEKEKKNDKSQDIGLVDGKKSAAAPAEEHRPIPHGLEDSILMDHLDKSLMSGNSGGRSRFMDLFSSSNPATGSRDLPKPLIESPPAPPSVPQSSQASQKPPAVHQQFSQQEAGRSLLMMLQKNDPPQSAPVPTNPPPMFKTLEDIEGEQLQSAQPTMPQHQQRPPFMLPQDGGMYSRPSSSGMEMFGGGGGSPVHRPSSPVQASRFLTGVGDQQQQPAPPLLHIPNDPALHKLLNLSHSELINMRDTGLFDHHALLTLIQMKQQKEAVQAAAFASAHRLPGHFQIPISVPISGQHHGLALPQRQHYPMAPQQMMPQQMNHVRMANGQLMGPQMRYAHVPPNMMVAHQEALMRQMSGARSPTTHLLAHEMAMLRMTNPQFNNHLSMDDLSRLEASRMAAAARQLPSSPTGGRPSPSPLLPTAVLRKTVQRGDSMTNMLPSSLHQSASSPQLVDQFQNRQTMQQQQQLQSRLTDEEQQQHQRNLIMAHREEEHHRNLLMAQHQLQGQYQYPGQNFSLSGHFSQHAHNLPQPDF